MDAAVGEERIKVLAFDRLDSFAGYQANCLESVSAKDRLFAKSAKDGGGLDGVPCRSNIRQFRLFGYFPDSLTVLATLRDMALESCFNVLLRWEGVRDSQVSGLNDCQGLNLVACSL